MILDWVSRCDPKPVVVVDSFIAFHEGNENDSAEMRKTMHGFRHLADLGAAPLLIHHSGKGENTKDYRGSSDFKAGIDVGYVLSNIGGDSTQLTTLRLKTFKARFTVENELILDYCNGRFVAGGRQSAKSSSSSLQELLITHPGVTKSDFEALATEKGLGRNNGRCFIDRGVKSGEIHVHPVGNTKRHTWVNSPVENY